eukprot:3361367-Alexandrium_andersonii.AAC.1
MVCGGDPTRIPEFWEPMHSHPSWSSHPLKDLPDCTKVVPLAMHGDSVPVSGVQRKWSKSVLVLSWCSLLARDGSTLQFNFLMVCVYKHILMKTGEQPAMSVVWKYLC